MKKHTTLLAVLALFYSCFAFGQAGAIYTVAGGGTSSAEGIPATSARIYTSSGVAVDASGNLYYGEFSGYKVRKVDATTGLVHTVAGTGVVGSSGDGGPAISAQLSSIRGIWVDAAGNIFIADDGNDRIRKVDATTGIITTVAGGGSSTADGVPATSASVNPQCVFVDPSGNIYTGSDNRVRKVDATTGIISTVAGGGLSTADGVPATNARLSGSAKSIIMDGAGNLYIIDFGGNKVRKIDAVTGLIYTVAGGGSSSADGVPATSEAFSDFHNCGVDGAGNLFIADWHRAIRRVDVSTGIINTIAGVLSGGGSSADGVPALTALARAYLIYVDPIRGDIYYSNYGATVRKFSYTPIVSFACSGTPSSGTPDPNTTSACTTTAITINLPGVSMGGGVTYQWQQSPDSVTWTSVSGATATTYSFTGLTSTKYFRCKTSCTSSGISAFSAGVKISYTPICPCLFSAGTAYPNTPSACTTTTVILTDTGYTATGITLQWQSSPDSTTWSDISGATAATYSFSGLSATTYYRFAATCTSAGTTHYTEGFKITYSPSCICFGTPVAGTATASTTICSACSLTLDLSGSVSASGLQYQWKRSFTGTSGWTNIPGATTVPYTHSPTGAYYYSCEVNCSASGDSAISAPVFVAYPYHIIADSIETAAGSSCGSANFFIKTDGVSPLLRVKSFYGDGTKDSLSLSVAGWTSELNSTHPYRAAGNYSIKRILYYNNIPQDSIVRSYEHRQCNTIPIKLFIDLDNNCSQGSSEPYNSIPVTLQVDSNGVMVGSYSITSGMYYKAFGPTGTVYTFKVVSASRVATCPASGVITTTITTTSGSYSTQLFGLSCGSGSLSDLEANVVVPVTGRHDQWGHIYLRNNYCVASDATVTLKYSFKYSDHASWRLPPSSWVYPTLTWTIPAVSARTPQTDMYFVGWASWSSLLTAGDTVVEEIIITPTTGTDCDTTNNHIIRIDTVKASCDPNLIEVAPAGCFDTNRHFRFTVHFENTGNDTAHNVYVLDTLSEYIDPSSVKVVMSSAEVMNIYPYTDGGYNIVKFDFPNIKLLDSSWHGLNDGAFIYTADLKPGMPTGASVYSRVGIYFDYNDVVMTNTVQNLKGCPEPNVVYNHTSQEVLLYPNPAENVIMLKTNGALFSSLTITNTVGQQVLQREITGPTNSINIAGLPAGVYYISCSGHSGKVVRKFVKW